MKKSILFLLVIGVICTFLMSCSENTDITLDDKKQQTDVVPKDKDEQQIFEASDKTTSVTEDILKALMAENDYCNLNVFLVSSLHHTGAEIRDNIYQVETSKFESYSDFKDYLLTVYKSDFVDYLLSHYPYEGQPKYVNIDGMLCIDTDLSGARGYYVDWSSPKIQIVEADESSCTFVATGILEEPAEFPVKEEYSVEARAVLENGRWVLEKMLY